MVFLVSMAFLVHCHIFFPFVSNKHKCHPPMIPPPSGLRPAHKLPGSPDNTYLMLFYLYYFDRLTKKFQADEYLPTTPRGPLYEVLRVWLPAATRENHRFHGYIHMSQKT